MSEAKLSPPKALAINIYIRIVAKGVGRQTSLQEIITKNIAQNDKKKNMEKGFRNKHDSEKI